MTDANLMLGRVVPEFFPKVFGPDGDQALDGAVVREHFAGLAKEIQAATGDSRAPEDVAEGFRRIAVENMANAIKKISTQRGYDVSGYTLCCFGGAGGQHACDIADTLGMSRIFLHPYAGVLSAYGMGLADITALRERAVERRLSADLLTTLEQDLDGLVAEGVAEVRAQGIHADQVHTLRKLLLRTEGSDTALEVPFGPLAAVERDFADAHRRRFGFLMADKALVVEAVSVEVIGRTTDVDEATRPESDDAPPPEPRATTPLYAEGQWRQAPVFQREDLVPGVRIDGPAIIIEATSTTVIEAGWRAHLTGRDHLVLDRVVPLERVAAVGTQVDPVMLEIFNNLFMSIAEQMGSTLANTAYSVNIKERLDFSCALFTPEGNLVANAPHMPVHLGSMSESIRAVIRARAGTMNPGDVYMLNAPYNGGTHLPDITVITPVFDGAGAKVLFFVASRGHHADVGGITPGSMPPDSQSVDQEGVLIDNFLLVDGGRFREAETLELFGSGPYPARNPAQNLADLKAQIAANEKGVQELARMIEHFGLDVVHAYMGHVQDNAEEQVRRVLDVLKDGAFAYPLDDGSRVAVEIRIDKASRSAEVDFSASSAQQPNNFNAPSAVCRAAVLYVFRTLVADAIPMNEGCLKPIKIVIPEGSMLHPRYPAAVVAGNVETSQIITDTLYGALGTLAASQGTMNNLTFGNQAYQYYETICGGSGAGPGFDGTDAVHTHMTNSRLTDPEVLEWRFPVVLESFEIRRGSGGEGRHRGGDGAVRRLRFREAMTAAILSSHRIVAPFGVAGGGAGARGRNWVERAGGKRDDLTGTDQADMAPGDVFVVETPGGGGFGSRDGEAAP